MWKIRRQNVYEIVEQSTGRVVASELTEEQARSIYEAYSKEIAKYEGGYCETERALSY